MQTEDLIWCVRCVSIIMLNAVDYGLDPKSDGTVCCQGIRHWVLDASLS